MRKIILLLLILAASAPMFSQTGFRTKLISQINPHPGSDGSGNSALWGYTAPDGREYAILGCYSGTSFIDITDSNNVREIQFLPAPLGITSHWREMKTYSHYAYIVSESQESKIQIVDLQYLPDSISYIGQSNIPNHTSTHSISQSGHYLYLNGCYPLSGGIAVVDLSNPVNPVLRGTWNDLYVHDSRIVNDTIWACNISNGKVSIIDASNKDSLKFIRDWVNNPLPNSPHNIALSNDRNYAFVTNELGTTSEPGNLKTWDVSDLDNITLVNTFNPYPFVKSISHNVEVHNNFAFVAYYTAGVKILDITNPSSPVEIGWFDTYPDNNHGSFGGCWGVYYFPSSGKIIASDRRHGLFVIRPDLSKPVSGIPKADFTVEYPKVELDKNQTFIDMTEGLPDNWHWTITGPETQTSTSKNPILSFSNAGNYNVTLRASNSFGTDSIVRSNSFEVIPVTLQSFVTTTPSGFTTILTSPSDTGKILFDWTKSVNSVHVSYKIYFKKIFGTSEEYIQSGNNGRDTSMYLTKSYLDSMALRLGLTGDSVRLFYRVKAYNGADSLLSTNLNQVVLKRNTTGISSVSESVPSEYFLHNNYPNPFNPSTNILFDIPKQSNVKLTLYDITGKEVLNIFNETLSPGSYKYSVNLGSQNSGVYFVRINAGEYNSVIKIVLIK